MRHVCIQPHSLPHNFRTYWFILARSEWVRMSEGISAPTFCGFLHNSTFFGESWHWLSKPHIILSQVQTHISNCPIRLVQLEHKDLQALTRGLSHFSLKKIITISIPVTRSHGYLWEKIKAEGGGALMHWTRHPAPSLWVWTLHGGALSAT